jgi:hypothetical protein
MSKFNTVARSYCYFIFLLFLLPTFTFAGKKTTFWYAHEGFEGFPGQEVELEIPKSVALERQEVFISISTIRVSYFFKNLSTQDEKTLITFPIPEFETPDEQTMLNNAIIFTALRNSFALTVDGHNYPFTTELKAFVAGKDVSAKLKSINSKIDFTNGGAGENEGGIPINGLSTQEKDALVKEGLADKIDHVPIGGLTSDEPGKDPPLTSPRPFYIPKWSLKIVIFWEQVFPAGKTIRVEHSYLSLPDKQSFHFSKEKEFDFGDGHLKNIDFCVDDYTKRGIAKKMTKEHDLPGRNRYLNYTHLKYNLTSANSWRQSIKDFRLTIEKPSKNEILTTCFPAIKKINDLQFEARLKDFNPKNELDILFVRP